MKKFLTELIDFLKELPIFVHLLVVFLVCLLIFSSCQGLFNVNVKDSNSNVVLNDSLKTGGSK